MKMKWTPEQERAITIPVSDTIVSAAAGSGKTAVMAERIISRLTGENHVDIDKILVVTYTNAAASEIKERVMKKIVEKLKSSNDDFLQKQLILINNAHFCTIHSFCLELIKKYFYILGINPAVKTGDPTELDMLLSKSASNVIGDYLERDDSDFISLLSLYADSREEKLRKMIVDLYKFAKTMPDFDAMLLSLPKKYDGINAEIESFVADNISMSLGYAIDEYTHGINMLKNSGICEKWLALFESERAFLKDIANGSMDYETLYQKIHAMQFMTLPTYRLTGEEAVIKNDIKKIRDKIRDDIIKKLRDKYFSVAPEFVIADNLNIKPMVSKLSELVRETEIVYTEQKQKEGIIDFSDYEHMALRLLRNPDNTPSDIAYSVSDMFEEIYIDEYQDCNNIQNTIFSLISGEIKGRPNMFCVGDMKQSIYKFRDANPLNFKKRCDASSLYTGEKLYPSNKIFLNANFRSRPSVLYFVNSVFYQLMSDRCGELSYDSNEALNAGGHFEDTNSDTGVIDIDIINESDDFGDSFPPEGQRLSRIDAEVSYIASKIKSYIDGGYLLYDRASGTQREAKYSDITILMRSPKAYTSSFERIFSQAGIPVYCDNSGGYFDTEEIAFLISFMKIVDNPDDDIALVTVLKNPIFGFDENMLLKIRLGTGTGSYYRCIREYMEKFSDSISKELSKFITLIDELYHKSAYMPTDEFLSCIISEINYNVYLSSFADYKLRKANVRFLLHKAKEFEANSFRGIYDFVRYIDGIKDDNKAECAKALSSDDNVVRVMSIHKSKGLEFPIVFLSGLGRQYNMNDANKGYVIHKNFGIGLDCVYPDKAYKTTSLNKLAIRQKIRTEAISEEMRVLYVALTRPIEKLVCTAVVKNGSAFLNKLEQNLVNQPYRINPYLILHSSSFIELILLASMRSALFESASGVCFENQVNDGVRYSLTLKNISEISLGLSEQERLDIDSAYSSVSDDYPRLCRVLGYKYPHFASSNLSGNISVTEIKKLLGDDAEYNLYDDMKLVRPSYFGADIPISGSAKGTLMHLCMERINFADISDFSSLQSAIDSLVSASLISDDERKAIDDDKIWTFISSPLGKRMATHRLYKEFAFKYMIKASEIYDIDTDDEIVVQGTIDAYFEDDDGSIVLVDYKTDKVKGQNSELIAKRYRVQLDCYAKALEKILGKKVKQRLIYLFDTNETIEL